MNYENSELLDRLAAEYVIGTLRGAPRRRFARLAESSAAARAALHRWEDDLTGLALRLAPVTPAAGVWTGVRARLVGRTRRGWSQPWRYAAAAAVLVLGLLLGIWLRQPPAPPATVTLLQTDASHPQWRLEAPRQPTTLTIRAVQPAQLAAGKAYELWALPRGGNPVSLGLLPTSGTVKRELSTAQLAALQAADKVAVSIEPAGGSPTGAPTGPVVIVANVGV